VQRLLFSSSCYSSTTKAEKAEKAEKEKCKSTEINSSCFNAVERSPINFRIGIREFGLLVLDWGFSNADLKVLDWGLRILESLSMSTFFATEKFGHYYALINHINSLRKLKFADTQTSVNRRLALII